MRAFDRWQAAEPVRLYAYGVLTAAVAAALLLGWLTDTQATALGAVLTAVLAVPGVEAARAHVYAPATLGVGPGVGAPSPVRQDDAGELEAGG